LGEGRVMFERIAPEQHDTLPEIPEPSENPRLVGHQEAANLLVAAYRAGKLHHGLLLAGPQGIGKATLAFHLAYHVLKHPNPEMAPEALEKPDPGSQLFRLIAQDAHPSVLHLTRPLNKDGKSFKTVLTVDEVRRVNRFLSLTAHDGGFRFVIVDATEDMNNSAANALLKNLEEPPARTIFILISHQLGRLLPTIRSRSQVVRLAPLSNSELIEILSAFEAGVPQEPSARQALAEQAGGSARTAILLTQYGGLEIATAAKELLTSRKLDVAGVYKLADAVSGRDRSIQFGIFNRHVLDEIAGAARRAAEIGVLPANRLSELWQQVNTAIIDAETYNLDRKQHVIGLMQRLHSAMRS
jgi:DNA polymerase-3 subunit delta'